MDINCGHDNDFVEDVPDHLTCAICCFALKNPVQLISCGHRFCRGCFEAVKVRSVQDNIDVLCPTDRQVVDTNKIFEDKGIERLVYDLHVKCPCSAEGCVWTGELRNLDAHIRHRCSFEEKRRTQDILKDLQVRLEKCEKQLQEKDKCIADVQDEFSVELNRITGNMNILKGKFEYCQNELRETRADLNFLKENRNNVHKENTKKRKLTATPTDVNTGEHSAGSQCVIQPKIFPIIDIKCEDNAPLFGNGLNDALAQKDTHGVHLNKFGDPKQSSSVDVEQTLKENVPLPPPLDANQTLEENIQPVEICAPSVTLEDEFKKMFDEVKLFRVKQTIVKQIMSNDGILFKWHLKNYTDCWNRGVVYSPSFYAGVYGHSCRLILTWSGEGMNTVGIFFQIITANKENRNPFSMSVELGIDDKNGIRKRYFMSCSKIQEYQPNFEEPNRGGKEKLITMPELQDFVINDSMHIRCKLIPS